MASWGKCDYKQMQKMAEEMRKFDTLDRQKLCEDLAKEIAARLLRKVIKRTPVGETAMLKGMWRIDNKILTVVKKGNVYELEIINSMDYASYVEFGHRTSNHKGYVEGRYMLTISEQEIQNIAPKLIEKRIMERLVEVFG